MVPRSARAAALAALVCCASAPSAGAQDGVLVAQLAQAQPERALPPLTDDFGDAVGAEPTPEPTAQPTPEPTAEPTPEPAVEHVAERPELPDTGAEPLVLALAGLGLVGTGIGLRRTADEVLGT